MSKQHSMVLAAACALVAAGCSGDGGSGASASGTTTRAATAAPTKCGTDSGSGCAPQSARVDLAEPVFSRPTEVTNPLFPIARLHSALLLGNDDGRMLRVETTLLPGTKTIDLNGRKVEALVSQYVAYLDGRILEVALDWYAQDDEGAVWYLGEDVFNYEDGAVANREGTWLAGKDGPAAMIMPARPRVGDVYRPENSPGIVFEEVTVKSVGKSFGGPQGRVGGAIVVDELHQDGAHEVKVFAPGYGEFKTGSGGSLEDLALAVPTGALSGPAPAALEQIWQSTIAVFDAAGAGDWKAASAATGRLNRAWSLYRASSEVPPLLAAQMTRALTALAGDELAPAARAWNAAGTQRTALDVGQATLDLLLRHRQPAAVDLARFELWARQVQVDAAAAEPGAVAGDVETLARIRDRFAHTLDAEAAKELGTLLEELKSAAEDEDLEAAADLAADLRVVVAAASVS
jgi:hypothetical protein